MAQDFSHDHHHRVLRYWWTLELFNPQKLPKLTGKAHRPEDEQVVDWRAGQPLPWVGLRTPATKDKAYRKWRHTVYLGVYDLEDTYQYLHSAFANDQEAYDERRTGLSACATVQLDERGRLVPGSTVLSSALWATARLAKDRSRPSYSWSKDFSEAEEAFEKAVDDFEGARREAVRAQGPVPHDERSLHELLRIAHQVSGTAGNLSLARSRIRIQSKLFNEKNAEKSAATDFLNSMFLDDLAKVGAALSEEGCPTVLWEYLVEDTSVLERERVDVLKDHATVDAAVSISRLPKGRWPSNPGHALALRQQLAVNQALNDLAGTRGLLGVNGPPGTGKTTMLRDVLAGNIVERARRLASLERPEQAFTETVHTWESKDKFPRVVRQLRPELTGFEMVVASANNGAVDNISVEIPSRDALDARWQDQADYFAQIASVAMKASGARVKDGKGVQASGLPAWGLVAARLGKKENRSDFYSAFWFGNHGPSEKQKVDSVPGMLERLQQWQDGQVPHLPWPQAVAEFREAERHVDALVAQRQAAQERQQRLEAALKEVPELDAQVKRANAEAETANEASRSFAGVASQAEVECAQARQVRDHQLQSRPGVLETLFTLGRAAREWRQTIAPLDQALLAAEQRLHAARSESQQAEARAHELFERAEQAEAGYVRLLEEVERLDEQVEADRRTYRDGYPGQHWAGAAREMRAPWLDAELDEARSELFLAALRLHADFLANTASIMLDGLRAAIEVVAGVAPYGLEEDKLRAAWQLFFLAVPMVSTTFASFGRVFDGLGAESLGWLLIDEAGQACPQYAAGAIWRSQRAVVVGDPLQLQPVVTMPSKAQHDIAAAFGVSPVWVPSRTSVQTLTDRTARFGTTLYQGEEAVWVSAPLTVHRRCDDPMFSLCNEIAYGNMMVSGVHRLLDDLQHPDRYDTHMGPRVVSSRWLDVPARERGTHLQKNEIDRLRAAIDSLIAQGVPLSEIIAISPFRAVANKLGGMSKDYPGLSAGTIHTAQGKEADVVFLVLGGDPGAPGAKAWASSTVNLVNVAASRAKRRLYVIGDRAAWSRYNYFSQLAAALGSPEVAAAASRLPKGHTQTRPQ